MTISINSIAVPNTQYLNVNFGWYYLVSDTVVRATSYTYTDQGSAYPPGNTTLYQEVTGSAPYTVYGSAITVYDNTEPELATDFDIQAGGFFIIDNTDTTHWSYVQYGGIVPGTPGEFTDCIGFTSTSNNTPVDLTTFPTGSTIYDPRWNIPVIPLDTLITFDAQDQKMLGLPTTEYLGLYPVEWIWDLGNGINAYGPQAQATYNFNVPPQTVQISLTVIDNLGNEHIGAYHPVMVPKEAFLISSGSGTRH
jgi:hypothetical protein